MCHLYAIGACDRPWQEWCEAGRHLTKKDWDIRCKNLADLNREQRRREVRRERSEEAESYAGSSPPTKRARVDSEIDPDDI